MKDLATKLLQKADRAITAAETLFRTDPEAAANRAYYALFYVADALLAQRDLRFKKHSAVHSAFGREYIKTGALDPKYHDWLLTAFNKRIVADYTVSSELTANAVQTVIEQAKEFASVARRLLTAQQ